MADDWQLEAVHEQFRGKREGSLKSFSYFSQSRSIKDLVETVQNAISQHMRAPLKLKAHSSERQIASQIIKAASDGNSNYLSFKYSFIVIIANQEVKNRLWKLPIFVVELLNGTRFFVDLKCTVYKSWKAFLQNNDLPPCDFCYPVDGKYSDQLKIDYARSPSAATGIVQSFFSVEYKVISAACVAGTFFFKIVKCVLGCATILLPIATKLIPVLAKGAQILLGAGALIENFRCGVIGISELMRGVFGLLDQCNSLLDTEVFALWLEIKKRFESAYDYLNNEFGFRSTASGEGAQISYQEMAITYKTDSEFKDIKEKADKQVFESVNLLRGEEGKRDSYTSPKSQNHVQNILDESKKDNENYSCMNKKDFSQETCDLVKISANFAKHVQGTRSESIHSDTLEALSDTLKKSYKQKLESYQKMVKAAEKGAGHKIDLKAFNEELGIKGDYKEHYWKETFRDELINQGPKLGEQIRLKILQLKSERPMMIHPITEQDYSVNHEGIFLWRSYSEICEKGVLSALEENIGLRLKEEDLVINLTECNMIIRDRHYIIFVYQSDKRSQEGLILIKKFEK